MAASLSTGLLLTIPLAPLAGALLAGLAGRSDGVCTAIAEQYLPEGPDSPSPSTDAAALLAVLSSLCAQGTAPTGAQNGDDPLLQLELAGSGQPLWLHRP